MVRCIILILIVAIISCTNNNEQNLHSQSFTDTLTKKESYDVKGLETKLGNSNYVILLPDNYSISEARGKEGQLGYNIFPKDSSSTMFGFIEIIHGSPISDFNIDKGTLVEILERDYQGKNIRWRIHQTETGYYVANVDSLGKLSAEVSSKNRFEIDSLISVISTVKEN